MTLYILSMLWALFTLGVFLYVLTRPQKFERMHSPLIALIGIGLFFRLIPAFILVPTSNYDIDSYKLVGQHVIAGEDVYSAPDTDKRHPYLPFQMVWSGFSQLVSGKFHVAFESFVRLAPIFADVLISLIIYSVISRSNLQISAVWASLLFAVNPLSIYVSAYHGQFDAVPLMLLLLAVISARKNEGGLSGFWLGFAVLTKSWPILAFPQIWSVFRGQKQKILFAALVGLIPLAAVLIYVWLFNASFITVIKKAVTYNSGIGVWGYTYLLRLLGLFWSDLQPVINGFFSVSRYLTLALLGLTWLFVARKQDLFGGVLTLLIAFFAFTHAFSIQYLIWLLPFAIIDGQFRWLKWYTLAAFSYMFLAYHTLILRMTINQLMPWPQADLVFIIPAGLAVWWVTLAWFWARSKNHFTKDWLHKTLLSLRRRAV